MRMQFPIMTAAAIILGSLSVEAKRLDIPPRLQWNNRNGYCGECSIQQAALFFGTYVSQYRAREIIDPTQRQDVWVPENSGPVLDALRLRYEVWDSGKPTPQWQAYLVWIKGHLKQGHPVLFDVFVKGGSDPDYDHIMLAIGYESVDAVRYRAEDRLFFNDNYISGYYSRTFRSMPDTRAMTGNGARHEYCIPRDINRGCAILGIRDASGTARRIRMKVDRWSEPNVTRGFRPVRLNATLEVRGLTPGRRYALLRYDHYWNVPTSGYLSSAYDRRIDFTASAARTAFTDTFMSDACVIYRCVPVL